MDTNIPIDHCLIVYGTLAPGKINHHQLDGLTGTWTPGSIKGRLAEVTEGEHVGLVGLVPADHDLDAQLFVSADLPSHWRRLDDFEGRYFRRERGHIKTADGVIEGWIYCLTES